VCKHCRVDEIMICYEFTGRKSKDSKRSQIVIGIIRDVVR
jgi:hypothetical protein